MNILIYDSLKMDVLLICLDRKENKYLNKTTMIKCLCWEMNYRKCSDQMDNVIVLINTGTLINGM
jgi:hypothetical protein